MEGITVVVVALLIIVTVAVLMVAEYALLRNRKQREILERLRQYTEDDLNAPFVHDTEESE